MDWIMPILTVGMLIGLVLLFMQNRKLAERVMTDQERAEAKAKADAKAAKRDKRKKAKVDAKATKRNERKKAKADTKNDDSDERSVRPVAVIASVVILAMLAANLVVFSQMRSSFERQLETALEGASESDEQLMAELEAEVKRLADEAEADSAQAQRLAELGEQIESLEAKLEALRAANDELEATQTSTSAEDTSGADPPAPADAIDAWMEDNGWEPESYRTENIVWSKPDAGNFSFTAGQIRSNDSLSEAFSTVPEMKDAVLAADSDVSDEELALIMSGQHHIAVQILEDGMVQGNTYLVDGKAVYTEKDRPVKAGDVIWVYIGSDGNVLPAGNVRADCGNPGVTKIVPREPKEEPPKEEPPKEEPPKEEPPKEEPPKEEPPEEEEPKCFDSDGNPVFEGEFCADPDEGPEQQDPRDDEVEPTPGYDRGDAEETRENQDEARDCIDAGECDPHDPTQDGVEVPDSKDGGEAPGGDVTEPDEQDNDTVPDSGNDNPDHDGSDPTENPDDGTSDPEDTPAEDDEDENEGDPLDDLDLPNVP